MWGPGWMAEKGCRVYLFLFYCSFSKEKNWNPYKLCWTLCVGSGNPHYPVHRLLAFLPLPGWSSFTRHLLQFRTSAREWSGRVVTWWRSLGKFSSFQLAFTRYLRKDIMFTEYFTRLFVFISLKTWQARISQDRHADTDDHSTHSFIPGKMLPKLLTRSSLTFISNVNLILEISYEIPSQSLPNQWMDLRKILNLCIFNISSTS